MSESSKVKAWAVKNGVELEAKQHKDTFVIKMDAPTGKCFIASDSHSSVSEAENAKEAWKMALADTRQGIENCPVVCECREGNELPRLNTERAVVVAPPVVSAANDSRLNREAWLTDLAERLRPMLVEAGAIIPASIKLSCGWPSKKATGSHNRAIGQCFAPVCSAGGVTEMFISPSISDPLEVAATTVHELIHASGLFKHTGGFKKVALAVGLEGKMTATAASERLKERLNALLAEMPAYPHSALTAMAGKQKKDGTRLLKVVCPSAECGYVIRTTQKWVEVGFPTCPCGTLMGMAEGMPEAPEEPEGE